MHPQRFVPWAVIAAAGTLLMLTRVLSAEDAPIDPAEKRIAVVLDAGPYARLDVPVSVLVDAPDAESVWVEFPDGSLSRSQLVEPGLRNEAWRGTGKKELHFNVSELAEGAKLEAVAIVSDRPIEGRRYVWSGEPSVSRRLSCSMCHQGLAPPTAQQLRDEWMTWKSTGKQPPLVLPRLLPTAQGTDNRWHASLGKFVSSACWECHGRHMIEYQFGQSLASGSGAEMPSSSIPNSELPAALRSVYHQVFRVAGDRTFSHRPTLEANSLQMPCGIHYGFTQANVVESASSDSLVSVADIVQRHAGTLSEEAGKFVGRHNVMIDWVADKGNGKTIAQEERQLTVKNMRARNGTRSLWIDFASKLSSVDGRVQLDGNALGAGFRFVVPVDPGTQPEYRASVDWNAITFQFDAETYTAVCFHSPQAVASADGQETGLSGIRDPLHAGQVVPGIAYAVSGEFDRDRPLLVECRLWIQGDHMSREEIESMAHDYLEPIRITAK